MACNRNHYIAPIITVIKLPSNKYIENGTGKYDIIELCRAAL